MRINIYSQELTQETELVSKTAHDTGITYYGIRLFLRSPKELHHRADDDDRSAITFWIPNARSMSKIDLANTLHEMADKVANAPSIPRN